MVHCWKDEVMGFYDCYFASFGETLPDDSPPERPAIFRYTAGSFRLLD